MGGRSTDEIAQIFSKTLYSIKKLARKYDAFIASDALIKQVSEQWVQSQEQAECVCHLQIPRLLGPGLSKGMLLETELRTKIEFLPLQ